jgi:hypothetical protein
VCAVQPPLRLSETKYWNFNKNYEKSSKAAKVVDFSEPDERCRLILGSRCNARGMRGATQGRKAVGRAIPKKHYL